MAASLIGVKWAMSKSLEDFYEEAKKTVTEITPAEAAKLIDEGGFTILDVREPDEFDEAHIPGAINIPRGFLEVKADLLHHKRDPRLQDRNQKIIAYCGGGYRSCLAASTLQQMGFESVLSVNGGWSAWVEAELPTVS